MGISSSLYTALTGMNMAQLAMQVATNNIANANTPGYSRQRVNLTTTPTWQSGSTGQVGTGVNASNITRYHDEFLFRSIATKSSEFGATAAQKYVADALETSFNESQGLGINTTMNDFFGLWDSVANDPEKGATREALIAEAKTMAEQLTTRRKEMDAIRNDINGQIKDSVTDINNIIETIAGLNEAIAREETPNKGQESNTNRDNREALLIQLSSLIDINYWENPTNGALNISFASGPSLLLNTTTFEVGTTSNESGDLQIIANNSRTQPPWPEDVTSKITGGGIGGWIDYRENEMKEFYLQYESFVDNFTFQVNHQHSQGVGLEKYTTNTSTSLISNHPATSFSFDGENNDLKITALVPHMEQKEPYDPRHDPENIAVRFVKADGPTNEITSNVAWDKETEKWEVTVTLPTDSNGNVTASAEDVIKHVNNEKTMGANQGSSPALPPTGVVQPYKVGDFINIAAATGDHWDGNINFGGNSYPSGPDHFQSLDRSLANMTDQGHHLSHGTETAQMTTSLKGEDNDLIFKAANTGDQGERVSVEYVIGNNHPQEAEEINIYPGTDSSQRITVTLRTDAEGNILTTAADIKQLINEHPEARNIIRAEHPKGADGKEQSGLGKVKEMDAEYLDRSGYFEMVTYDESGEPTVNRISVDPTDTLQDIVERIGTTMNSGIKGVRAEIITNHHGQDSIRIIADTQSDIKYAFRDDTSGILAVLGINNLFTGDSSTDIGVNQDLVDNPSLLGVGRLTPDGTMEQGNNENALDIADLKDKEFEFDRLPKGTLGTAYSTFYANIGASNKHITTQHDFLYNAVSELNNRQDSLAGVNIDDELSTALSFQYMYQAAAKMVSTIDEMMNSLLSMR